MLEDRSFKSFVFYCRGEEGTSFSKGGSKTTKLFLGFIVVILLLAVGAGIGIGIYIGATKDNGATQNAKVITDNGVESSGNTGGNTEGNTGGNNGGNTGMNNGNTDGDDIKDKKTTESMKEKEKQDMQNPFRATRKRKFNQPRSKAINLI